MTKLFGTDGIRGLANGLLTPELALGIGRATAVYFGTSGTILIGRDPRLSGPMLEGALASGIASVGLDVCLTGIVTTPGLVWLTKNSGAIAGAMLSASHNPMADNGIKLVDSQGIKLENGQELAIEDMFFRGRENIPRPTGGRVGRIFRDEKSVDRYCQFLLSTLGCSLKGIRVIVDCANGSASSIAGELFAAAGAEVDVIHAAPDGININYNCGSTNLASLVAAVKAKDVDLGLALDGDADRVIAVDSEGEVVDGDKIMLILAKELKRQGKLAHDTLVVTIMSNLGLQIAAREQGLKIVTTDVGDRFVLEEMLQGNYSLGGEQSGHIILREFASTGDGLLSSLQLMQTMVMAGKTLRELAQVMEYLPQVLVNVFISRKENWHKNQRIAAEIARAEAVLQDRGRVLVRPSGTEALMRIMLEGPREDELQGLAQAIAAAIKEELS